MHISLYLHTPFDNYYESKSINENLKFKFPEHINVYASTSVVSSYILHMITIINEKKSYIFIINVNKS